MMESDKCGTVVIDNLRADDCIDPAITDKFFAGLSTMDAPVDGQEAWGMAINVIRRDPDSYTCQGKTLSNTAFGKLLRLEDVKALRWHLPEEHLRRYGITDSATLDTHRLSDDELQIIVEAYGGHLKLGNGLNVVWVASANSLAQFSLRELVDRLGLINLAAENRCLILVYRHITTREKLHLPRSFDGIDCLQFRPVRQCSADSGRTLPLTLAAQDGLPEAVHRNCEVKPEVFAVEAM
jgi:hypothetical protein